jgi:hypothetical protein
MLLMVKLPNGEEVYGETLNGIDYDAGEYREEITLRRPLRFMPAQNPQTGQPIMVPMRYPVELVTLKTSNLIFIAEAAEPNCINAYAKATGGVVRAPAGAIQSARR